jgi:hypothetical protein
VASHHRERFVRLTQRRATGGAVCVDEQCVLDLSAPPSPAGVEAPGLAPR